MLCGCLNASGTLCANCEQVAEEMRVQQEMSLLIQLGAKRCTALSVLESWLRSYPELVALKPGPGDELQLHVRREDLKSRMQTDRPDVIFTSIERGLKHAGLAVVQSTHGNVAVKIWKVKQPSEEAKPSKPPRKRVVWQTSNTRSLKKKKV